MNFNRGEQKKSVGHDEDEDDFDWREELAREEREKREYEKRIKELGLDGEGERLARETDKMEGL